MSFISEFLLILEYVSTGIREIPQIKYALVTLFLGYATKYQPLSCF